MPQTRVYAPAALSANKGEVVISGAFSVNGASSPVAFRGPDGLGASVPAGIVSITHSGTGEYTLTFEDSFYAMTGAECHLMLGAAADSVAQLTAVPANIQTTTAMTQKITTLTAGSAADVAAASGNEVWFTFRFKRSMAK